MAPVLNEQSRRRFVALEAQALGRGGVSFMARITGLARSTIYHGLSDIRDNVAAAPGRIRKNGGGRKKKALEDPTLLADLKRLVEPATRGDPMQPLLWTSRSLRKLVKQLAKKGHKVCPTVVGNLLRDMGYSLQANSKTREGSNHIDRDAQFQYINMQAKAFLGANDPVISVDTKKKEPVGNFKNNGREWRPKGAPEAVNVYDFIDPELRRAVPYGVYDISNNVGWVSVGTDHETACFAVNAIRRWWVTMGKKRYPKAKRLLITADGGGSNGYRVRLWKVELQKLADELKLPITVCHFPPGTSKWNKIEHRLFSFITINWRGKPLRTFRTIVQLIAATTTEAGLKVRAELDENKYPKGIKVSDAQLAAVNLSRHAFHGDWNYAIAPRLSKN
jgi:Rhodopirellula transposase DDE domain